jgi:aminoglycoside phosphotransferase (APT) family kinase protein
MSLADESRMEPPDEQRLLTSAAPAGDKGEAAPRDRGPFAAVPITAADVARVWTRHGLGPVHRVERLAGGQINAAYRVNGAWVLRVRPAGRDGAAFRKERALLERLRGQAPVPEVVALDESGAALSAAYMICRWAPGEPLARVWLAAEPRRREWLLRQLGELLRALHAVRFPACGELTGGELCPAAGWRDYLEARLRRRLGIVRALPGAPLGLLDAVEAFARRAAPALESGAACLVHRDLHFGNLLVEGDRITALLDFEAALAAPPDYELDQLARFLRWPALFLTDLPGVEASAFRGVWSGLRRAYPELFQAPRLPERLALYALEYDLAALRDCLTGVWDEPVRRHVMGRMEHTLRRLISTSD